LRLGLLTGVLALLNPAMLGGRRGVPPLGDEPYK